jgi:hypothetical protein
MKESPLTLAFELFLLGKAVIVLEVEREIHLAGLRGLGSTGRGTREHFLDSFYLRLREQCGRNPRIGLKDLTLR